MKNQEIKKMSIANIDGKLTPAEMENIMAGSMTPCKWMAIGGAVLAVGLFACPATWVFVGGSAAAGFTTGGGIATAYSLSFSIAGAGC